MAAPWREFVDEETLALFGAARKPLGDDEWRAIVLDGASCGDVQLATLCVSIAARISRIAVNGPGSTAPAEDVAIAEATPLLMSKNSYARAAGARVARHIVRLFPRHAVTLIDLYKSAPAGTRRSILWLTTVPGDDDLSTQLFILGVRDTAKGVRAGAVEACTRCTSAALVKVMEECATMEPDIELRTAIIKNLSLIIKGYWLGEVEFGHRDIQVNVDGAIHSASIPQAAIDTYGEQVAAGYHMRWARGIASPTFREDSKWIGDRHAEWLASDDFKAFQKSAPPSNLEDSSDPAKRAALQTKLKAQKSAFVTANDFLDGNEDEASIGPNLDPHPGLKTFRKVLSELAKRPDIHAIYFEIDEVPDSGWPYAQWLHICTTAPVAQVQKALRRLKPDTVSAATGEVPHPAPPGFQWLAAWWD